MKKPREDLKHIFEKAMMVGLEEADLDGMTLYTKCDVIYGLVASIRNKEPQRKYGSGRVARESLTTVVGTFEASDNLRRLQDHRRGRLLSEIAQDEKLLKVFSVWDGPLSDQGRQEALGKSVFMHERVYLQGVADVVPVTHEFFDGGPSENNRNNYILLGGFTGDLSTGEGRIRQSTSYDYAHFHRLGEALNTAHHEMTHGIQFALANAYHHNRIRPSDPLYDDARMFHAIEMNMAIVPGGILKPDDRSAYEQQVHEVLAREEGEAISRGIIELL